jgi:flagellar FliJ protein
MRFKFSLDSVLKHRKRLEEVAQKEFAEAQANVEAAMRRIEEMYTRMDEVREEIRAAQLRGTGGDLEQIRGMETFLIGHTRRIEAARLGLRELMVIAEQKQELLIEAAKERKILDKLKERKKAEHHELAARAEAKELDDLTTTRQAWGKR